MISKYALRHEMLDALERASGDAADYYKVEHAEPAHYTELEDLLLAWLQKIGVKVSE